MATLRNFWILLINSKLWPNNDMNYVIVWITLWLYVGDGEDILCNFGGRIIEGPLNSFSHRKQKKPCPDRVKQTLSVFC